MDIRWLARGLGLIGDIDTLIAATSLDRSLTIDTTGGDFTRVPGLSALLLDMQTRIPVSSGIS